MAENRIATIVKEINYWKEHKLLPDVYCDFLLALYTNGEETCENSPVRQQWKVSLIFQMILLSLLLPFSFLVLYFTQFHPILQLSILFLFLCYSIWMYVSLKKSQNSFYHIGLVTSLLLLLLITVISCNLFNTYQWITYIFIIVNFIVWFLISVKNNLKYLMAISILAILFIGIYIVL